jgi:hypothetical protein
MLYKTEAHQSFNFHLVKFLTSKYFSQLTENKSFINQSLQVLFKIFLDEYLYKAKIGQSKNKKLFQDHIGAFTRNFHCSKKIVKIFFLNGHIFL